MSSSSNLPIPEDVEGHRLFSSEKKFHMDSPKKNSPLLFPWKKICCILRLFDELCWTFSGTFESWRFTIGCFQEAPGRLEPRIFRKPREPWLKTLLRDASFLRLFLLSDRFWWKKKRRSTRGPVHAVNINQQQEQPTLSPFFKDYCDLPDLDPTVIPPSRPPFWEAEVAFFFAACGWGGSWVGLRISQILDELGARQYLL